MGVGGKCPRGAAETKVVAMVGGSNSPSIQAQRGEFQPALTSQTPHPTEIPVIYSSLPSWLTLFLPEERLFQTPSTLLLVHFSQLVVGMHFISEFLLFLLYFHNSFLMPFMFFLILLCNHSLTIPTRLCSSFTSPVFAVYMSPVCFLVAPEAIKGLLLCSLSLFNTRESVVESF